MSITLCFATAERAVFASDSRARDGATYIDNVRKIDITKDAAFGATAHGNLSMDAWKRTPAINGESGKSRSHRMLATMQQGPVAPESTDRQVS